MAKEKSKVKWMEVGDSNTRFFHSVLRERRSRNNILILNSRDDIKLEDDRNIGAECVEFLAPYSMQILLALLWIFLMSCILKG